MSKPVEPQKNISLPREAASLLALTVSFAWLARVFLRPESSALTHPLVAVGLLFFLFPFRKETASSRGVWVALAAVFVWLASRLSIVWLPFASAFAIGYLLRLASQELQTIRLPRGKTLRLPAYAANSLIALIFVAGAALTVLAAIPGLAGQANQMISGVRTAYTRVFEYRMERVPIADARAALAEGEAPLQLAEAIAFSDGVKYPFGAPITAEFLNKLESIGVETATAQRPSYLEEWREDGGWIRSLQAAVIEHVGPEYVEPLLNGWEQWLRDLTAAFQSQFPKAIADALGFSTRLISDVVGFIITAVFALIVLVYLLLGYDRYLQSGLRLFPEHEHDRVRRIARRIDENMQAFVRSQFVIIVMVAALSTLAYGLAGVPFALLVGVLGGLLNVIPNVGPTLAGISAFFALTVGWVAGLRPELLFFIELDGGRGFLLRAALIPAAVFLVQSVDNALISPRLFSRAVNVDPLVIMLSILIGGSLFGFWGVLLAVPGLIAARSAWTEWNA